MVAIGKLPQLCGSIRAKVVSSQKIGLFWDNSEWPKKLVELYFNCVFADLVQAVRVYDVTHILFNGKNAHHFYEIVVPYHQGYWHVKGLPENRNYVAEIGVKTAGGQFFPLFRSNLIQITGAKGESQDTSDLAGFLLQVPEARPLKWKDCVSTYSYYEQAAELEEAND